VYGRDFITNGRGNPNPTVTKNTSQYYFFMTPGCFSRAAMKSSRLGKQIRQYFHLVDIGLRDKMGESLWQRLQIETPETTKLKEANSEYIPFGTEPGIYDFTYTDPYGNECIYTGVTQDMNTRFQNHKAEKAGIITNPTL
jgi:hypothetical protein